MNFSISDREFEIISELAGKLAGIRLTESKKALVVARLSSKLRQLHLDTFTEYIDFLQHKGTQEDIVYFINRIATNETFFFREKHHFDFLKNKILPQILENKHHSGESRLRIWSAACSTGEEAYSIAITVLEFLNTRLGFDAKILASDISTKVLDTAKKGEYKLEDIKSHIPQDLIHKYFNKVSKDVYKVSDEVRKLITFKQINFMDDRYPIKSKLDVIFCRNAMIYFDEDNRDMIINRFYQHLDENGYLVVGHSENLFRHPNKFKLCGNTIYKKICGMKIL